MRGDGWFNISEAFLEKNGKFKTILEIAPPLKKAKDVYKTMRILGETAADRRLAARLYAASIGAALVRHDQRISRQSDSALKRGLQSLHEDAEVPDPLLQLAGTALCALGGST